MLDEAYERKAWHGPNLRGSVRGLTAEQAGWRPRAGRHCIADIIVHAAYWKYAVRRRLRGEKRGSFPLKGSNWFPIPEALTEHQWREYLALLEDEHRSLYTTVAELPDDLLHATTPGSEVSNLTLIHGIANHDVYHTGQIQLLKRLSGDG
jgi:uncharacterized damage-inducible protein DinB